MELPVGRRVLVATVRGELGERIQRWRERHDAKHAKRLPPHLTVCYRPPVDVPLERLEAQVRHGFPRTGNGPPGRSDSSSTIASSRSRWQSYETEALDAARHRLFDERYVEMGGRHEWPWHITSVRYGHNREDLRRPASAWPKPTCAWTPPGRLTSISYLELRNGRYAPVAEWRLSANP